MFSRSGIAGVSSIFKSLFNSISFDLIKALDDVASQLKEDEDESDVDGVSMMACGGFNSDAGECFMVEMGD